MKQRIRLATAWLSGCSGCHMGLLNLHAGLLELFEWCDLVYSPLADIKQYPHGVDLCLVEGAVGSGDNRVMAEVIRERTAFVVSLGDCAVNGNVAALRNPRGKAATINCVYPQPGGFTPDVPALGEIVLPLHHVIAVDAFIPGCPPAPDAIGQAIQRFVTRM